jgi:hypothetical protein
MSDAVSNTDDARLQEIVRRLVKAFEADTDIPSHCSLYSGGSMS